MSHFFHSDKNESRKRSVAGSLSGKGLKSMKRPSDTDTSSVASTIQPVTQRYAFINEKKLEPTDKTIAGNKDAKKLARDTKVRDFKNETELKSYANKGTDYIGNVGKEEIWVRFKEDGINLIGEDHEFITLKDVLGGVFALERGKWVYEGFTDIEDELRDKGEKKHLHKEVKSNHEKAGLYKQYKIDRSGELEHAAESMLPRLGFILSYFLINGQKNLDEIKKPQQEKKTERELKYSLKAMAMGIRYAWIHGKDVVDEIQQLKQDQPGCLCGYKPAKKTEKLLEVIEKLQAELDPVIDEIKYSGSLEDVVKEGNNDLMRNIAKFSEAMLNHLVYIKSQKNSGVDEKMRTKLKDAKTPDEKHQAFADLRNDRFRTMVSSRKTDDDFLDTKAIRYAGMGANHLDAFNDSEWLDRKFDMQADGFSYKKFSEDTKRLKTLAQGKVENAIESKESEEEKTKPVDKKSALIEIDPDQPPRKKNKKTTSGKKSSDAATPKRGDESDQD